MKKIKLKYKLLISGFPEIKEEKYQFHEFYLTKNYIDNDYFQRILETDDININAFLYYSTLIDENKLPYVYTLDNKDFIEFEVANSCSISRKKINLILKKYPNIIEKIENYISEIRLTLNIPISSLVRYIYVYNESDELLGKIVNINPVTFWNRLEYIDSKDFNNNTRFHINWDFFNKIDNYRYKRALTFFNESFESNKIETRFIMLISCIESLFNYRLKTEESITERVSSTIAKIMSTFDNDYNLYYEKIKRMYNMRSKYLHGANNAINIISEKELRRITRIILIFYMIIIYDKKYDTMDMIKYLNDNMNYEFQHRLILKTLLSKSFKEQQESLLKEIKRVFGNIVPKETEEYILSKVNK